jgi:hypothetical protein
MHTSQTPARVAARVVNLSPKTRNQKSKQQPKPNRRSTHFAAAAVLAPSTKRFI